MTGVAVPSEQRSLHETSLATPRPTVLDWQRLSDCSFIGLFLVHQATMCPVLQAGFPGRLASALGNSQLDQPVRGRLHIYTQ
jgi:hypothetical protein